MPKYRCPHCQEVAEWPERNRCPRCGKIALRPGFFARKAGPATHAAVRAARRVDPASTVTGGLWESFVARRASTRWMLGIAAVLVLGALIWGPSDHNIDDFPPLIQLNRDNLATLHAALEAFRANCGRYPTTAEGLAALVENPGVPGWHGAYVEGLKPDSWKHPFRYASDGTSFTLFSAGPDGLDGTKDDLIEPSGPLPKAPPPPVPVHIGGAGPQ